ncbi:PutA family dehydrogenase, putative [Talaromyces stipitatus ATCC 10500]|uniref:PutA family dehydrogenase, putative n=1 Tax=Talaromyces stipitatus (strain ATCC 10500 / CBS 375.48 / QM 6759 / NRRL 1006) TaxID=441959 RepID=B8LWM2_TALSN|nr:PutA family dehydrogenase, putative [Talaromyces stipitatus ATCC 10500]EED24419.1 PutA family dehydrogenase, putative [Talaromyces stipitatus ATCC 10500]
MSQALQSIREAAVDGRAKNIIWRQVQLENLQLALIDSAATIQAAIQQDSACTATEAAIEYFLTLKCLNENYESLDVQQALKDEYAITRGQNAECFKDPVGVVYIVPTTYNYFYSVVSATGAAVTAGNCVVIELQETLRQRRVSELLRELLKLALDHTVIEFTSTRASDEDLSPNHIRLFQEIPDTETRTSFSKSLFPLLSFTRTAAIVDRTADLTSAAEAIATARFAYGGNSPYAPDFVLVNEFVKGPFLRALMQASMDQLSLRMKIDEKFPSSRNIHQTASLIASEIQSKRAINISSIGEGILVDVNSRESQLLRSKIRGHNILLHNVRSLDDAIDLASQNGELLATYTFADPASGKYVSQFIPSRVSFVNQIPFEILVGPPSPETSSLTSSFHVRYTTDLFSIPRPQYILKTPLSQQIQQCLSVEDNRSTAAWQSALISQLSKQITATRQKRRPGGQLGFFEQGILLGLGMTGVPILLCVGTLAYYGLGFVWRNFRLH